MSFSRGKLFIAHYFAACMINVLFQLMDGSFNVVITLLNRFGDQFNFWDIHHRWNKLGSMLDSTGMQACGLFNFLDGQMTHFWSVHIKLEGPVLSKPEGIVLSLWKIILFCSQYNHMTPPTHTPWVIWTVFSELDPFHISSLTWHWSAFLCRSTANWLHG